MAGGSHSNGTAPFRLIYRLGAGVLVEAAEVERLDGRIDADLELDAVDLPTILLVDHRRLREPKEGQRITISVRATPRLKALLEVSANQNSRSLSLEAERLLERAFDPSNRPASVEVVNMIVGGAFRLAEVMQRVGEHFAKSDKIEDVQRAQVLIDTSEDILQFKKEPPK